MSNLNFGDSYFANRHLNDSKRMKSFLSESQFLSKFIDFNSSICDIGCSTGEFLDYIQWRGPKYGIEINKFAASEASKKSIIMIDSLKQIIGEIDAVVMRGTLQHLPSPFEYIADVFESLRPGGYLFLLATPNIDSIYYRTVGDLPAFDFPLNYWLPGFKHTRLVCEREGFTLTGYEFPYRSSGYASILDFPKFLLKIFFRSSSLRPAFPGNMMNLALVKPIDMSV